MIMEDPQRHHQHHQDALIVTMSSQVQGADLAPQVIPDKNLSLYFKEAAQHDDREDGDEDEPTPPLNEAEQATEFLQQIGLADLSHLHHQGVEIAEHVVNDSVRKRHLTEKQAQTVRSRVFTLNKTLKTSRQPRRKQRQDVRDVTWKRSTSTGSRSRSATPDSLDSTPGTTGSHHGDDNASTSDDAATAASTSANHRRLKRTDVRPAAHVTGGNSGTVTDSAVKAFKKNRSKADVANLESTNVVLKGYHQLRADHGGTITRSATSSYAKSAVPARATLATLSVAPTVVTVMPEGVDNDVVTVGGLPAPRERSDSDPTAKESSGAVEFMTTTSNFHSLVTTTQSADTALSTAIRDASLNQSREALSFEGMVRHDDNFESLVGLEDESRVNIDEITDSEYQCLKSLLLVEITAIFDQHKIAVHKRKPNKKRNRGSVFGVDLTTLVMRDNIQPRADTSMMVPCVYQLVLRELTERSLREDGVLRIASHKQKLDALCAEIEGNFYTNRELVERSLLAASVHDLTGVLKRLLRDLPEPIFTMELFDMFYKCSAIPNQDDKVRALNLLVLLLPVERRTTFRLLLNFFNAVVANEDANRMTMHNVAMIIAPSFFPPRLLSSKSLSRKLASQVAAVVATSSSDNIATGANPTSTSGSAPTLGGMGIPAAAPGESAAAAASRNLMFRQIRDAALCCDLMHLILRASDTLWTVPVALAKQASAIELRAQHRRYGQAQQQPLDANCNRSKKKLHRSSTQYEPGAILNPRRARDIMI